MSGNVVGACQTVVTVNGSGTPVWPRARAWAQVVIAQASVTASNALPSVMFSRDAGRLYCIPVHVSTENTGANVTGTGSCDIPVAVQHSLMTTPDVTCPCFRAVKPTVVGGVYRKPFRIY